MEAQASPLLGSARDRRVCTICTALGESVASSVSEVFPSVKMFLLKAKKTKTKKNNKKNQSKTLTLKGSKNEPQ